MDSQASICTNRKLKMTRGESVCFERRDLFPFMQNNCSAKSRENGDMLRTKPKTSSTQLSGSYELY